MLVTVSVLSLVSSILNVRAAPQGFPVSFPEPPIPLLSSEVVFPLSTPPDFSILLTPSLDIHSPVFQQSTAVLPDLIKFKYDVLYSRGSATGTYFNVVMGLEHVTNPNFLPHPSIPDSWIVVAQRDGLKYEIRHFAEFTCVAQFINGQLQCTTYPSILPVITYPASAYCGGQFQYTGLGPHDSRVFHGPQHPYTIFGAQSSHTCFGLWIQDLSTLVGPLNSDMYDLPEFIRETELQRPGDYSLVEKNWFVFWDQYNNIYAHYDIAPERAFAKIAPDGSAGENLATAIREHDQKCMSRHLPEAGPEDSIHQATNTLAITLCKRADQACRQNAETYIFHMFQWKTYDRTRFVGHYEPYLMLFKQNAPFELYGISQKPFWFSGRLPPGSQFKNDRKTNEMLYVVSMSWKSRDQKYHGFLDDELLIGFGIEDDRAAGIIVLAEDLMRNLAFC